MDIEIAKLLLRFVLPVLPDETRREIVGGRVRAFEPGRPGFGAGPAMIFLLLVIHTHGIGSMSGNPANTRRRRPPSSSEALLREYRPIPAVSSMT
jgi:hypothetical protein